MHITMFELDLIVEALKVAESHWKRSGEKVFASSAWKVTADDAKALRLRITGGEDE